MLNVIYSCDYKAEFTASLLQSSVSHDSSEIIIIYWFDAQETFLIVINVENFIFLWKLWYRFQDSFINGKFKTIYFKWKKKMYCYFWWINLLNSSICADFVEKFVNSNEF